MNIFITGESGTIPIALQNLLNNNKSHTIVNSQINDINNLICLKKHQSFKLRKHELDFLDKELFEEKLSHIFNNTDVIIHSGAYVGTDFCNSNQEQAILTNVQGTLNIINICNLFKIKLIYFSTTAIFDINNYSKKNYITENTNINPQTLYGITKYSGELIVKKLCKTDYTIVRPVFGFGNYPDDLHSALTKIIHNIYYNYINKTNIELKVLLNKNINKSYTRVENIAASVIKILDNKLFNNEFNIGEHHNSSKNFIELFEIITEMFCNRLDIKKNIITNLLQNIIFIENEDYLHWHNIDDSKLKKYNLRFCELENYLSIQKGIYKTIDSVIQNIKTKPYWIDI